MLTKEVIDEIIEEINAEIKQCNAKVNACEQSNHLNKMIYFNGIISGLESAKVIINENIGSDQE